MFPAGCPYHPYRFSPVSTGSIPTSIPTGIPPSILPVHAFSFVRFYDPARNLMGLRLWARYRCSSLSSPIKFYRPLVVTSWGWGGFIPGCLTLLPWQQKSLRTRIRAIGKIRSSTAKTTTEATPFLR